jgi:hypothetical protein
MVVGERQQKGNTTHTAAYLRFLSNGGRGLLGLFQLPFRSLGGVFEIVHPIMRALSYSRRDTIKQNKNRQ